MIAKYFCQWGRLQGGGCFALTNGGFWKINKVVELGIAVIQAGGGLVMIAFNIISFDVFVILFLFIKSINDI